MPYEKHEQNIFADKIKTASILWQKNLQIISNFEKIFSKVRTNKLTNENIATLPEYTILWESIAELFMAIRFRYLLKFEEKKKEAYDKIIEIFAKYRTLGAKININETQFMVDSLTETCSINRFDDVFMDQKDEEEVNIEEAFRE